MLDQKQVQLVDALLARTEQGKLDWEATAKPGVFQTAFPGYVIQIDGPNDCSLWIVGPSGDVVDEIRQSTVESRGEGEAKRKLSRLYSMARRYAQGASQAIDALLAELTGDAPY